MAERRMFAKTIVDSDVFLDMPLSAQALYFHLSMRADDDGFINNPKKIQRMIGCNDDDMTLLIAKRFILVFESGVIVIKHWKIHNYIQKDRYKPTVYQEEKKQLVEKSNKSYTLDTECIQNGYSLDTQDRIGKDRLGKVSLGKDSAGKDSDQPPAAPKNAYQIYQECFGVLNSINQQDITFWIDDLSEEMVIEAMKKAVLACKPYSYAKGIMKQWSQKGIKTVEDAEAEEVQFNNNHFKKQPVRKEKIPYWAQDGYVYEEKKGLSDEEVKEIREWANGTSDNRTN